MIEDTRWFRPGVPLRPERVNLTVPARYRAAGEEHWHLGRTENISRAGVLIRGVRLFGRSSSIEASMNVPAGILPNITGDILIIGTVARLVPALGNGPAGIAIAFERYRPADERERTGASGAADEPKQGI